jgi:3-oxoacyl-(acyl-carrier-protein) synthase
MDAAGADKVAITGYGSVTAGGRDSTAARAGLYRGEVRALRPGPGFFPEGFPTLCFRVADDWLEPWLKSDHPARLTFERAGRVNRTISLALTAVWEGLVMAGLGPGELQKKRVGIAMGTTVGCTFHNEEYYKTWRQGGTPQRGTLLTYLGANLAAQLQTILGVAGPRAVITNACASGTDAIGIAKSWLEHDLCDVAIAGGADELSRVACHGFKSLMLVSERACTPFDSNRQGLNLGEGAGIFVMEPENGAVRRKAEIRGRVLGYGIGGDAYHPTAPHPEGRGLQLAVGKALSDAGLSPGDISLINAHGTGTRANDPAETKGIAALGFSPGAVPMVSTKGVTGHTLGAAGGVEAVFTLMDLNAGETAGTVGCTEQDPALSFPVVIQGQTVSLGGRIGMSQSLAFGGSNSALIIEGRCA